jgi:hypothetical protein
MSQLSFILFSAFLLWGCNETPTQEQPTTDTSELSSLTKDAGTEDTTTETLDSGSFGVDGGDAVGSTTTDAGIEFTPAVPRLDGGLYEAPVHLTLGEIIPPGQNSDGSLELWITNRVEVAGTQLRITGVTPKPGPTAGGMIGQLEGWNSQVAIDGMYLSFYLSGNPIPPSDSVLTVIPLVTVDSHEVCVTQAVVSDPAGNEIERSMGCIPVP